MSYISFRLYIVTNVIAGVQEMSNITGTDRRSIENVVDNSLVMLVRQPPLRQFGIGMGAGWLSGYVFIQVSRLAGILGGCTALMIWVSFSKQSPPSTYQ